jgi:hypothetical protein
VFRTLLKSPHLTRLRALQLARTGLGDGGVRALVASNVFRRLEYLNLSHTDVTARGLHELVSAIRNRPTALRIVVLRGAPRLLPGALPPLPPSVPIRLRQSLQAQIGLEVHPRPDLLAELYTRRTTLSPDLQRWVEWLRINKLVSLRRAVEVLPLPDPVRRAFTMVCQRRLVWNANRLGFIPPEEDSGSEDLAHLLKLLFEMSEWQAVRTLAECLLDLYLRYERGELPPDGRTRLRSPLACESSGE